MDDEEVNIDDLLDVSSGIYIEKEIAALGKKVRSLG